ncbi:hypothetical protein JHK85_005015 [Glycine max]|nr:hypothetical protein JHK85_005015 [Glycine max]KAG5080785.1 hypothetical protein JHK86_004850 [Glycine max]
MKNKNGCMMHLWIIRAEFPSVLPPKYQSGEIQIPIEFSERITHFGISSNLIMYPTRVMHEDLKTTTNNVNCWKGATTLLPLIGGFVGDAYTGQFHIVLFSSLFILLFVNVTYVVLHATS